MMEIRCETCSGAGEIEICSVCSNMVENCECEAEVVPPTEMEECSECDGEGVVEEDDDDDAEEARS